MLRVALTGGVGSGKSAAAEMLRALGARVSQSDEVGRAMMQPGQPVFERIVQHFGGQIVGTDGKLDRPALARITFGEGRIEELNAIVHPAVIRAQAEWFRAVAAEDPGAVAVVESALIFETKHGDAADGDGEATGGNTPWRTRFDRIVVMTAPVSTRKERYLSRVSGSALTGAAADFDRRVATQWSDERKAELADFVIVNDGTLMDLQQKIADLYTVLQREALQSAGEAI